MSSSDSLVAAISVMLAAYGLFFTSQEPRVTEALSAEIPGGPAAIAKRRRHLRATRSIVRALMVIALGLWLLLLKPVVNDVQDAIRVCFSLKDYSAVDVIFFVLANSWLAIAGWLAVRSRRLSDRIRAHDAALKQRGY